MVQTALGNSNISAGCGVLAISITALAIVRCLCIGAWTILLRIGAFFGVVTFGAAIETDNIGIAVEVVRVPSGTGVVIGTAEAV